MPFCPRCRSEYRRDVELCAHCQIALIEALPEAPQETSLEGARHYIETREPLVMMVGALEACREIRDHLLAAGIPCLIAESVHDEAAELGHMHQRYEVVIATGDLERVRDELRGRFDQLLENEGVAMDDRVIEVGSGGDVTCPACGTTGPLAEDACGECGLYLGAA